MKKGKEQRKYTRFKVPLPVEVRYLDNPPATMTTADICDGGVFLNVESGDRPPVGATIFLKLQQPLEGEDPPTVEGEVVRENEEGIGVRFIL
jgi:c-di-GMP-binding flagellar brake protein YcgR